MKMREIEEEMKLLSRPNIKGKDAEEVRQIKTSLFHARLLVTLSSLAMALKAIFIFYVMSELDYDHGQYLVSQMIPMMVFVAAYALTRLILSHLHLKYGDLDFEVELVEK